MLQAGIHVAGVGGLRRVLPAGAGGLQLSHLFQFSCSMGEGQLLPAQTMRRNLRLSPSPPGASTKAPGLPQW